MWVLGLVVPDVRKAPRYADIAAAPLISEQTISTLKQMFPNARVVLTEVEDRKLGSLLSRPGATGRQRRSRRLRFGR